LFLSFRDFVEEAKSLTFKALTSLKIEPPETLEWDEPPDKEFGDVSLRVGYQVAKKAQKTPAEIVALVSSMINDSLSSQKKFVGPVEGHPSGFLNFKMNDSAFIPEVVRRAHDEDYGGINLGGGSSVIVEHTAVNPNKALHIGHLRNVAIGDSLARILEFTGHKVSVLNYIDDSGLQVADILVGFLFMNHPVEAPEGVKYDHYAGDSVYVSVNKEYEKNPKLKARQKHILKAIEGKDPVIFPFAAEITSKILQQQLNTCWRFGAFYDLLVYESDIVQSKLWESVLSNLKERGIAKFEKEGKYAGCWIVSVKEEKEGEDKVLVRADGTATYIAKDTPLAALKVGIVPDRFSYGVATTQPNGKELWRTHAEPGLIKDSPVHWGADQSITVIDSRQARLQRIIQYILEQLTGKSMEKRNVHLGYSIISLSQKTAASLPPSPDLASEKGGQEEQESEVVTMSGRKGTYINADDVLDAVKKKAHDETAKRNPAANSEYWLDGVAETLAIAATRFSLLKQDLDKMIVFDMEDALQLIGETGPYMLYTYARASGIASKVETSDGDSSPSLSPKIAVGDVLKSESEVDLVKLISKFDIFVEKSVKMLAPKWIAHYSFQLCEAFNKFYEKNRVLQEENEEVRKARIELVDAFRTTLRNSLSLLGIGTLDRI
jgi:arginyl-tRNA synthetase